MKGHSVEYISNLFPSWKKRIVPMFDKSAWFLIAPAAVALFFVDPSLVKTLLQWSAFALVLAGVSIMLCRVVFPQIHLSDLITQAEAGNTAAGLVVAATVLFFGILFFSLIYWAKS